MGAGRASCAVESSYIGGAKYAGGAMVGGPSSFRWISVALVYAS